MIIQCEKCSRKFKVDDSEIRATGSGVRCPNCGHGFQAGEKKISYMEESLLNEGEDSLPGDAVYESGHESDAADTSDPETPRDDAFSLNDNDLTDEVIKVDSDEIEKLDAAEANESVSEYRDDDSEYELQVEGNEESDSIDFSREPEADTLTDDAGNWEEFVSISKSEEKNDDFVIDRSAETDKENQDFNWESLRIDNEPVEVPDDTPKLFEDDVNDIEQSETRDPESVNLLDDSGKSDEEKAEGVSYNRKSPEALSIDMEVISRNALTQKGFSGLSAGPSYPSARPLVSKPKSERGVLGGIAYGIIAAAVFIVIITALYIILLNTGVVPRETSDKILNFAQSIIPLELSESGRSEVIITEHTGSWMNTRNGPLFIVSGMITNRANHPVHFVKIHSEFLSAGQILFENDVYAGNTFTENELKVSPLQDILLKLKKKNGNIDYYNTNKLAGLNYNIQPGESIPFYTVFLPQSRVLGLKYNLKITDYEAPVTN